MQNPYVYKKPHWEEKEDLSSSSNLQIFWRLTLVIDAGKKH